MHLTHHKAHSIAYFDSKAAALAVAATWEVGGSRMAEHTTARRRMRMAWAWACACGGLAPALSPPTCVCRPRWQDFTGSFLCDITPNDASYATIVEYNWIYALVIFTVFFPASLVTGEHADPLIEESEGLLDRYEECHGLADPTADANSMSSSASPAIQPFDEPAASLPLGLRDAISDEDTEMAPIAAKSES